MDPRPQHKNPLTVFNGAPFDVPTWSNDREDDALEAVGRFIAERGRVPTAKEWTAAGLRPAERTIRRRFGSFHGAAAAAYKGWQ